MLDFTNTTKKLYLKIRVTLSISLSFGIITLFSSSHKQGCGVGGGAGRVMFLLCVPVGSEPQLSGLILERKSKYKTYRTLPPGNL